MHSEALRHEHDVHHFKRLRAADALCKHPDFVAKEIVHVGSSSSRECVPAVRLRAEHRTALVLVRVCLHPEHPVVVIILAAILAVRPCWMGCGPSQDIQRNALPLQVVGDVVPVENMFSSPVKYHCTRSPVWHVNAPFMTVIMPPICTVQTVSPET